ncbi:hypothetical protein HJD18_06680 [Thermoleophilia bacterium SCSIO 60948]|nr:hypothetical protein HJD18_06680 [Thermoleophilia bacterium SCSIO 60948]
MTIALLVALFGAGLLLALGTGGRRPPQERWRTARRKTPPVARSYDPGRELRAERKARELLASVVSAEDYELYESLGFIAVAGRSRDGVAPRYGYLVYPHRPIIAYDTRTLEPLSEYCVGFPDHSDPALGQRLPDADDVLAKWMSLRAQEERLIAESNMHLPGRQVDPRRVRGDLLRLRDWRASRARAAA